MYWPQHHLARNDHVTYIGSIINKTSNMHYDVYVSKLHKTWAVVHGAAAHEYGSGCVNSPSYGQSIMDSINKDYLFGLLYADYLAAKYFANRGK